MCFAYCHIAYISFGSCKDCVKKPPLSRPPSLFTHTPSPFTILLHYGLAVTDFPFFAPLFSVLFHKRGSGFLAAILVNSNCKGLLLLQRGLIMLSFSETFFLKMTRPIALISLPVFRIQKLDSEAHRHDCLNCKHQLNVCKFLLVLEAQILDTAFSSGAERCRSKKRSAFSQYWGLHFVPPLPSSPFHHSSSVINSIRNRCKKSYFGDHSSVMNHPLFHRIINLLCVSHVQCVMCYLFQ
jgi:hypothetical protein